MGPPGRPLAAPVAAADPTATGAAEAQALTAFLRDVLLKNLPDPLVETGHDWGRQKDFVVGMTWHKFKAEPRRADRNDGHWEKLRVQGIDPPHTLSLGVKNLTSPEPGRTTFDAVVALDIRLTYEQQFWKAGTRLTAARPAPAALAGPAGVRVYEPDRAAAGVDPPGRGRAGPGDRRRADLPRPRLRAHRRRRRGRGEGDRRGRPGGAEEAQAGPRAPDLLARANAGIVKAADTKDVRVEFDKLLAGKVRPSSAANRDLFCGPVTP